MNYRRLFGEKSATTAVVARLRRSKAMLEYLGIVLAGGAAYYLGWNLFSGEIEGAAASRLEQGKKKTSSLVLKLSRSLFRSLVLPYSERLELVDWRKKQKRLIVSAGLDEEIDPGELLAFKIFLGFIVPSALAIYLIANGGGMPIWLFFGMVLVGYVYPSVWISGRRKRRHEEIRLQLPFVIDLLTLSTEAGLDFIGALQKVVEKTRSGPLVNEIERMLQEIQLGTTRADSLRNMGWRIDLQEISSLVAVLVTADQMGSSLGAVLRVQSELIRAQRFTMAEKRGAAASQKILFANLFHHARGIHHDLWTRDPWVLWGGRTLMKHSPLWVNGKKVIETCWIAKSFIPRFLGLMGRRGLPDNEAVLFPKCNSIHTFFMRFPIDVVFLAEDGTVVDVIESLGSWRMLLPRKRVKHTVELRAARCRELGITPGSRLEWGTGKRVNVEV